MTVATKFKVVVHYPAAEEPFRDEDADGTETIGRLKARVLDFFGLVEGQTPEGNIITYTLFEGKQPVEDPNLRLTDLAGEKKVLQLKLSQQITQG